MTPDSATTLRRAGVCPDCANGTWWTTPPGGEIRLCLDHAALVRNQPGWAPVLPEDQPEVELPNEHTCPGGCGRTVHNAWFACRQCWRRLPPSLQTPILTAHWAGDEEGHSRALANAMHYYRNHRPFTIVGRQ